MLLIFPSSPMAEKASKYLEGEGVPHRIIAIPESLGYKTGADHGIYIDSENNMDVPMKLSRERFVVMRVFRDFKLEE